MNYDNNKRYYSANEFFKNKFGCKIIKIPVDGGFTCPNRDGTVGTGGCIFCSEKGSGDFTESKWKTISEQFESMKQKLSKKWKSGKYIIYFQSFTNTYAPVHKLEKLYMEALSLENAAGLSIATRPDCITWETVDLLKSISEKSYVAVELGLQSSNEKTAAFINRCYKNDVFENAVKMLKSAGIDVICHIIFGLPGETKKDMMDSVCYAVKNNIDGIKLQLLHILKGTRLAEIYMDEPFKLLALDEYADLIISAVELLPPNIVVHRITGDGPKNILIGPLWSGDKKRVLNAINREFEKRNTYQGASCGVI